MAGCSSAPRSDAKQIPRLCAWWKKVSMTLVQNLSAPAAGRYVADMGTASELRLQNDKHRAISKKKVTLSADDGGKQLSR